MRLVVVSAHYPPNFVSGGTLQPQRLARGMRDRGHDVSVFAGWLGDRPPLEQWDEPDETGMAVRWVVTTPWTSWDDRRNFDNPRVAGLFAAHLAKQRPDVVHLHSLQTLGAGLVSVAKDSGARVIVTMHDFWWSCARQFLVTREFRPCSLVVDAGSCPCQLDHDWLRDRAERLRWALSQADAILAPSRAAAEVLAANGISVDRLIVDENGLSPAARVARVRRGSETPLRVLYTGGPSEMKGAHVLVAAMRRLGPRDDLLVRAHGLQPYLDRTHHDVGTDAIQAVPPFAPDELDDVLGAADVLVLPSVMRESHSLITREALLRGVPVVTSNCLGPEDVVAHEVNGLVLATGDDAALARALNRLAQDRAFADRLAANALGVDIVELQAQLDHLDDVYASVAAPPSAPRTVRRVLFLAGIEGAPLRYRARLPAEALQCLGIHTDVRHYRSVEAEALLESADVVVVYRVPATAQVLYMLARARASGTPVFFDVDDLIFDPELASEIPALQQLQGEEATLWLEGVRRYRTTMEACDAFIGSTARLCDHAESVVGLPAERFSNGVGMRLGGLSDAACRRERSPGPLRIGYFSGTTTHDGDWRSIEKAVVEVLLAHPDAELWVGGHLTTGKDAERLGDRLRRMAFMDWTVLPGILRDVDINLAPLGPGEAFNDAKSALKWLEAALVETVTVASPTQPFQEVIRDGANGVLAGSPSAWTAALQALLADADLRTMLGQQARRDALLTLSPHLQGPRYLDILERGGTYARRTRNTSTWVPLANDEPSIHIGLEPYDEHVSGAEALLLTPLRQRLNRVRALLHIANLMRREVGLEQAARRAAGFARRGILNRKG